VPSGRHSAKRTPLDAIRPLPIFAECLPLLSAIFCRVRRSAKQVFAECPKFGTRQRFLHSANHAFPVVLELKGQNFFLIVNTISFSHPETFLPTILNSGNTTLSNAMTQVIFFFDRMTTQVIRCNDSGFVVIESNLLQ